MGGGSICHNQFLGLKRVEINHDIPLTTYLNSDCANSTKLYQIAVILIFSQFWQGKILGFQAFPTKVARRFSKVLQNTRVMAHIEDKA